MSERQSKAPLFEAVRQYSARVKAPMHVPGHKLGRAAPPAWHQLAPSEWLALDLTEAPDLDDLHAPNGIIAEAQSLAAEAFGAERTHFLVGGTTAGLHALILAASQPGDLLAVPRHAHRSILGAMILAGVMPRWIPVEFHPELDIARGVSLPHLHTALPGTTAAVLLHPTYHGYAAHIEAEIKAVQSAGLPALVDEAHGSHFAFHPALPPSSLSAGADGVVQSTHKTGGSLTQSSLCHIGYGSRLDPDRVAAMLRLVQSTSPSYLLMVSLDLARRELVLHGRSQWDRAMELAQATGRRLASLRGIRVHASDDPTKLLIDPRGRGLTGFQAAEALWRQGVAVETAGLGFVLAVVTPGDDPPVMDQLVHAVAHLPQGTGVRLEPIEPPWPQVVLAPREAYLGRKAAVRLEDSVGRIAAEMIAPYPPGIPVLAPGERITSDVLSFLRHGRAAGHHIQGAADPTLRSIQVVWE